MVIKTKLTTYGLFLVLFISLCQATFAQVSLSSPEGVDQDAVQYWDKMGDHLDPAALDQFILKFPNSSMAKMAFALRYTLLSENPNIEDYNAFLKIYPDRFQSQIAIQEVFELYRDQNRAGAYLDFLKRYPNTQQALVAKLRLQTLMFEFVALVNKTDEYEAFIDTFPDAPQIIAVSKLAYEKDYQSEKAHFAELGKEGSDARMRRANKLTTEWEQSVSEFSKQFSGDKVSKAGELVLMYRIERRATIIRRVYAEYNAVARIRQEERHQEILTKLDAVQKTLIENNAALIETLQNESKKICEQLKAGFELLHQDNLAMKSMIERKFEAIEKGMLRLHEDMITIHHDLLDIRADLKTINDTLKETNLKLDRIEGHLKGICDELIEVRKELAVGFKSMGDKLDVLQKEVKIGFDRTHQLQRKQLDVAMHILTQTQNMATIMDSGFDQIIKNQQTQQVLSRKTLNTIQQGVGDLKTGQQRQIALAECNLKIGHDIAQIQMKSLNAMIVSRQETNKRLDQMDAIMQTGFNNVDQNIWATSEQSQRENRNMLSRIGNERNHRGDRTRYASDVPPSMLGDMLGSAVSWVPLVGPLLGRQMTRLGDVIWDQGRAAAYEYGGQAWQKSKEAFREYAPEMAQMAEDIYYADWEQRKNLLFAAAARLTGQAGIPPEFVAMVASCVTGDDLEKAVNWLANYLKINPKMIELMVNHI